MLSLFWSLRDYRLRLEHWNLLDRRLDCRRLVYGGYGNSLSRNHLQRCDWFRTRNTLNSRRPRPGIFNGRVCQDNPAAESEGQRTYYGSNSGKICGHGKGHGHLQCPEANARIAREVLHALAIFLRNTMRAEARMVQLCDAYVTQVRTRLQWDPQLRALPINRSVACAGPLLWKPTNPRAGRVLSTASGARQRLATNRRVCRYQFVTFRTSAQSLTPKRPHPSTVAQDLGPADWLHHPRDVQNIESSAARSNQPEPRTDKLPSRAPQNFEWANRRRRTAGNRCQARVPEMTRGHILSPNRICHWVDGRSTR